MKINAINITMTPTKCTMCGDNPYLNCKKQPHSQCQALLNPPVGTMAMGRRRVNDTLTPFAINVPLIDTSFLRIRHLRPSSSPVAVDARHARVVLPSVGEKELSLSLSQLP